MATTIPAISAFSGLSEKQSTEDSPGLNLQLTHISPYFILYVVIKYVMHLCQFVPRTVSLHS